MSDTHVLRLEGRIFALELMVRALLTDFAARDASPRATAEKLRDAFMASLQNVDRQIGESEDAVWEAAADETRLTLDRVIQRIEYLQELGELPPDS